MLIINLKDLMVKKGAREGKRISYKDIFETTQIRVPTLSRIANDQKYNISREHIEKLCIYFDVTVDQLISILPD